MFKSTLTNRRAKTHPFMINLRLQGTSTSIYNKLVKLKLNTQKKYSTYE